jgi:hypothetical protein
MTLLLLALACRPAAPALPPHQVFADAPAALRAVWTDEVRVLGVGEVHATIDGPAGETTLARFTAELLPALKPTDLVIETWRVQGACTEVAAAAAAAIQTETHRPPETPTELARLVQAAVALGVRPHDLALTCEEHASLTDDAGAVQHGLLLRILTDRLREAALQGLATPDARVVLYGGAVHNDLAPREGAEAYSYAVAARAAGGPAFVELDLLDVAVLRAKPSLIEPAWAALVDLAAPDRVILHQRAPGSYVMLLSGR